MEICGFQKTSLLDYPDHISSIIFTRGCNLNCGYCHNSNLLSKDYPLYNENEILKILDKIKNHIEGVVISGGEPTIQKDLYSFVSKIKNMGLLVKVDTNGTNIEIIKKMVSDNMIDYIAMDIKNSIFKYKEISNIDVSPNIIKDSIKFIINSGVNYEFRTTAIKGCHNIDSFISIADIIIDCGGFNSYYYIQNFKDSDNVRDKSLMEFTDNELNDIEKTIKIILKNTFIR